MDQDFWFPFDFQLRSLVEQPPNESESSPSSFPGYAVSSTFASSSAFDLKLRKDFDPRLVSRESTYLMFRRIGFSEKPNREFCVCLL